MYENYVKDMKARAKSVQPSKQYHLQFENERINNSHYTVVQAPNYKEVVHDDAYCKTRPRFEHVPTV